MKITIVLPNMKDLSNIKHSTSVKWINFQTFLKGKMVELEVLCFLEETKILPIKESISVLSSSMFSDFQGMNFQHKALKSQKIH